MVVPDQIWYVGMLLLLDPWTKAHARLGEAGQKTLCRIAALVSLQVPQIPDLCY